MRILEFPSRLLSLVAALIIFSVPSQGQKIQNFRPYDKDGVNMFEPSPALDSTFEKTYVRLGGNFTQQFQALDHSNNSPATPLYPLGNGFNLATANLNLDVQLVDGIRLNLITYLSSRHHPEAWVKGGYIQIDKLPFLSDPTLGGLMDNLSVRIGHMEVNYGDTHFRRTDNGNAMYNPFVGNYIMDAFNTEIGGEIFFQKNGILAVASVTGGEINGNIQDLEADANPDDDINKRNPSIIGKLGYDNDVAPNVRLRVTGSVYHTSSSAANHLYDGDRGGSRYYLVMAPPGVGAGDRGVFPSGRFSPGFTDKITAVVGNVFVKASGFELFGFYEMANGRGRAETEERSANQFGVDLLYRIGSKENVYVGGRYNVVNAEVPFDTDVMDVSINRFQIGAGWFITKNILAKVEYVQQQYKDYPANTILSEGEFSGLMLEAVVGF